MSALSEARERLRAAEANPDSHLDEVLVDAADLRTVLGALDAMQPVVEAAVRLSELRHDGCCAGDHKCDACNATGDVVSAAATFSATQQGAEK